MLTTLRLSALLSALKYVRLVPFDSDSLEGRAAERYRLIALGTIATAAARVAAMILLVLTVRWLAPTLGAERFGVWATFSGLATMLSFLDLGVANALVNQVAHASATGDQRQLSEIIMGGIGWLVVVGIVAAVILGVSGLFVPWRSFLKLSTLATAQEAKRAAVIFSCLFGLNLISGGLLKILSGQQRGYEGQMIAMLATLVATPVVYVAAHFDADVGALLIAGFGLQSLATLILVLLRLWYRGLLHPNIMRESMRLHSSMLLSSGGLFFVLQIGSMIGWGGDTLLVASVAGAADVAIFVVAQRLFQFATQPVGILNGSLLPAYADAYARHEHGFILATLRRSLLLSALVGGGLSLLLLVAGPFVIPHWTKDSIVVPWSLLAAFAVWTTLDAGGTAMGVYLVSAGRIRIQALVISCFCIVALPAKVWGASHGGATGLVTCGILSYFVTCAPAYFLVLRGIKARTGRNANAV